MIEKDLVNINMSDRNIPFYIRAILESGTCRLFLPTYFHVSDGGRGLRYTVDRTGYKNLIKSFDGKYKNYLRDDGPARILGRIFSAVSDAMYRCIMPEKYVISGKTVFCASDGQIKLIYLPSDLDHIKWRMETPAHRVVRALGIFVEDFSSFLPDDLALEFCETYELMKESDINCQDMVSMLAKGGIRDIEEKVSDEGLIYSEHSYTINV